jgi:hypothetical protein
VSRSQVRPGLFAPIWSIVSDHGAQSSSSSLSLRHPLFLPQAFRRTLARERVVGQINSRFQAIVLLMPQQTREKMPARKNSFQERFQLSAETKDRRDEIFLFCFSENYELLRASRFAERDVARGRHDT